jgi:Ca2+-binding RTX toxin-like protein
MSTPTSNSVPVTFFITSGLGTEGGIIQGVKWGGGYGTGVSLTFSFPGVGSYKANPYGSYDTGSGGEWSTWYSLTSSEHPGVAAALAAWSAVANIAFTQTVDNNTTVGDLRFAITGNPQGTENAHAYYPSNSAWAGDVWLNHASWHTSHNTAIVHGTYDYLTLIHEIGHALGLKHSFESPRPMPAQYDSYSFTVMSYSASTQTHGNNFADFYPTTPMYYDLVAIQELYGAKAHNSGNNNYVFSQNAHYWKTIDDSGGIDTITYNGTNGVKIDLAIGHWSSLGLQLHFANGKSQTDTVCIGPRSVIENATGGSGNDHLNGNAAANVLTGNAGADVLLGGQGHDTLKGGLGADRFDFNSTVQSPVGTSHDLIGGFSEAQHDRIDLAGIDANSLVAGNQAFHFIGQQAFHHHTRELHVQGGLVQGDVNGDGVADFEIKAVGAHLAGDFIL